MKFDDAVKLMKDGKEVTRVSWNAPLTVAFTPSKTEYGMVYPAHFVFRDGGTIRQGYTLSATDIMEADDWEEASKVVRKPAGGGFTNPTAKAAPTEEPPKTETEETPKPDDTATARPIRATRKNAESVSDQATDDETDSTEQAEESTDDSADQS